MTTTDLTALERAVIEAEEGGGDADTAALVLADELEAVHGAVPCPGCAFLKPGAELRADCPRCNGSGFVPHPRAEFIRVQVGLVERGLPCPNDDRTHELAVRDRELLAANEADWRRAGVCPGCDGKGYHTADVRDTERARCSRCFGTGDVGGLLLSWTLDERHDAGLLKGNERFSRPIRWVRGLPCAVEVPRLSDVLEQGPLIPTERGHRPGNYRPTPWAAAVARHHPTVRAFVVGELQPAHGASGFFWSRSGGQRHSVPSECLELMRSLADTNSVTWVCFPTRDAAIDALARAVMRVIRAQLTNG